MAPLASGGTAAQSRKHHGHRTHSGGISTTRAWLGRGTYGYVDGPVAVAAILHIAWPQGGHAPRDDVDPGAERSASNDDGGRDRRSAAAMDRVCQRTRSSHETPSAGGRGPAKAVDRDRCC